MWSGPEGLTRQRGDRRLSGGDARDSDAG